ncbi:MAG: CHAT domain-containing protein, partial [Brachymonas sp.]|nr:CHAT domain-containing protein [Brachymonas sp.]
PCPNFPVLHVASHFQFTPGSEHQSYLVMGDSSKLSLADLKDMDFTERSVAHLKRLRHRLRRRQE